MKRMLEIERVKLDEASDYTLKYHRHSKPLKRHKFTIGVIDRYNPSDEYLGIVTVDNCSSHAWSKRRDHVEIRRCVVRPGLEEGNNVSSFLLRKAVNACFALGYKCVVTYTRPYESGASLLACGFVLQKISKPKSDDGLLTWVIGESCGASYDHRSFGENTKPALQWIQSVRGVA